MLLTPRVVMFAYRRPIQVSEDKESLLVEVEAVVSYDLSIDIEVETTLSPTC